MAFSSDVKNAYGSLLHPGKNTSRNLDVYSAMKVYYSASILPFILFLIFGIAFSLYAGGSCSASAVPIGTPVTAGCGVGGLSIFGGLISSISPYVGVAIAVFIGGIVFLLVLVPVSILVNAAIYQLVGRRLLMTYARGYGKTFSAIMYSYMPFLLFSWTFFVPVLKIVFLPIVAVWQLVIFIIAAANQQKITRMQSFTTYFATFFIIVLILIFVYASVLIGIAANGMPFTG